MPTSPIVEVHVSRAHKEFILMRYAGDPKGLSILVGEFVVMEPKHFRKNGLDVVRAALRAFEETYRAGPGQFQRMSLEERALFFRTHASFLVTEKTADLWQVDRMKPAGDGSFVLPIGAEGRSLFRPVDGAERFFQLFVKSIEFDES